jgi:gag-polyprotein putative aspartyl protease
MRSQDARNDSRRNGANMAQPGVTFREVFSDSEEEPDIAYYPAIHHKKPGRPPGTGKKTPYQRKGESSKPTEPVTVYKAPGFDEIDELAEDEPEDVRMSESPSRENPAKKYRRSRKDPNYNAWEDIKSRTVQMTFEQAAELNPTVKQQIRNGLAEIKREYKVVEINQARPSQKEESSSESEGEEDTRKTSAYAIGTIENVPVEYIIDTGAGGSMMSDELRKRMGWAIDCPMNQTFTIANGAIAVPLGKVREVPVCFGEVTIPIDMIIVQTTTYEVILGNEWLKKAHAIVDLNAEKMKITHRGKSFLIPLNIDKGIRPKFEEVNEEEEGAFVAVNEPIREEEGSRSMNQEQTDAGEESEGNPYLQEIEDEESEEESEQETNSRDKGKQKEGEFRILTQEERELAFDLMMQEGACAFCHTRVYCAEMTCDCPWIIRINEPFEQAWKRNQIRRPTRRQNHQEGRNQLQQEDIIYNRHQWKENQRSQPHPFKEEDDSVCDQFWETAPFVR